MTEARPTEPSGSGPGDEWKPASGNPRLNGIIVDADDKTGRATRVTRISYSEQDLAKLGTARA